MQAADIPPGRSRRECADPLIASLRVGTDDRSIPLNSLSPLQPHLRFSAAVFRLIFIARPFRSSALAAALVLILAAGCYGYPTAGAAADNGAPGVARVVETAQDFELTRWKGEVVYLDFWASWCGPCQQSFPWMAQMHEQYKARGLRIVAVNLDKTPAAADRFLARYPAPFDLVFNPDGSIAEQFKVAGMPHAFLIDRQGRQVDDHIGFLPAGREAMQARIIQLLESR